MTLSEHTTKKQREIALEYGVSQQAVSRIIKQYKETGSTATTKRSGRPRKTTSRTDALIRQAVLKNSFASSAELKATVGDGVAGLSTRTIRHRLSSEFKMVARQASRKPLITRAARIKRLHWCRQYKHWTAEEWKRVIFSDESTFLQFHDTKRLVRRPCGTSPYNPAYTVKTIKHSPSVMVWGCFSWGCLGALLLS